MINTGGPILNLALESDSSEEDEDIDDIKPFASASQGSPRPVESKKIEYESSDFLDAKKSIAGNQWDLNAWNTMIEEVESGRGGAMGQSEVYTLATSQFPRAAVFWKKFFDYHLMNGEMQVCEEGFRKCLQKCRNIDLWDCYITFIRKKTIEKDPPSSENYANAKRLFEAAFEKALDNIGMSPQSHIIWRRYLDFVKEWPENGVLDAGKKLSVLREIYQKAVCNPMEDLDRYWEQYEELELRAGEHLANQLLPEFKPKNQHARNVFKERKKVMGKILQDRIATPPSAEGSVVEMEQLDLWNKWLSYESGNPDNLPEDKHKSMMLMVFDKCLSCFYLHPEVWITLARFNQSTAGPSEARAVLKEGLTVLPQVPTLWFAMAEFEEQHSSIDNATNVLRTAFETVPCAFTFAALQRLIRRKDGKIAARKLFSETMAMRADGTLGYDVYLAHALLEVEVNNEPQVALRVLEMARSQHPVASNKVAFLTLMTKVLVRLGDVHQLRWVYQTALGAAGAVDGSAISSSVQRYKVTDGFTLEEQSELWQAYLDAELTLGMSDVTRLSQLRSRLESVKRAISDRKKSSSQNDPSIKANCDLFDSVVDIFSRCSHFSSTLPERDQALRRRSQGATYLSEVVERADQRMNALMDGSVGGRRRGRKDGNDGQDSAALAGVPLFLRDLLSKLPPARGPPPNVEAFLDHLKRTVLPPRPVTDEDAPPLSTNIVATDDDVVLAGSKRGLMQDGDDDDDDDTGAANRDDIFRKRRRMRMTTN